MERDPQEQNILNLFKDKIQLKQNNEFNNISMSVKKQKLFISDPLVYEIEGTDSLLILGTPKQNINIELLKKLYNEQLKKKVEEENYPKSQEEAIELVQSQVKLSKEEIAKALEENDFDVMQTILKLSK